MDLTKTLMALGTVASVFTAALAVTYMILWFKLPEYARNRRGTPGLRALWYSSKLATALAATLIAGELDLYQATGLTPWWAATRLAASMAMLVGILASLSRLVYELWQASLTVQFIEAARKMAPADAEKP